MSRGYIYRTSYMRTREYIDYNGGWTSRTSEAQVFDEISYNESYGAYKFEPVEDFPIDVPPSSNESSPGFPDRLIDDGTNWGYKPGDDHLHLL